MKKLPPIDAYGVKIHVGDKVRVVGVPDLSGMAPSGRRESQPVFEYLVGKYKKIEAFDDDGLAELSFRIMKGAREGYHWVWIEPFLLKVKKARNSR